MGFYLMAIPGCEQVDGPGDLRGRGYIPPPPGSQTDERLNKTVRHLHVALGEDRSSLRAAQLSASHWFSLDLQK